MEFNGSTTTTTTTTPPSSLSYSPLISSSPATSPPTSAPPPLPPAVVVKRVFSHCHHIPVVVKPCAACKILRRRCVEKCALAPYFPPTDPLKFTVAQRVFGASNIIKLLQDLPESQRADGVNSMVYEANARLRDPVYGCAGAICSLQKEISELQSQLAKAQAELLNMQCQQGNLIALICMEMRSAAPNTTQQFNEEVAPILQQQQYLNYNIDTSCFLDENCLGTASDWESLWA